MRFDRELLNCHKIGVMIINQDNRVVTITDLDSEFDWTEIENNSWGIQVQSITFTSVSDNEFIILRDSDGYGPLLYPWAYVNKDESLTIYYNGKTLKLLFNYSNSVCSASSMIIILLA